MRGARMCSPAAIVTARPARCSSCAIWVPLDEAPTTSTPPSATCAGLRYDWAVSVATDGGTLAAKLGRRAMLHAPDAMTTVRQRQSPRSVRTR